MNAHRFAFLVFACAAAMAAPTDEQALRKKYPWFQRELFDESHRDLLEAALAGPMRAQPEIVFACRTTIREHWYANFGYFAEGDAEKASAPIQIGRASCRERV